MYTITRDDLEKSVLLVPPTHPDACNGTFVSGECVCRLQIDYFTHMVLRPLNICVMCMLYQRHSELIRVASDFRAFANKSVVEAPDSVVYDFILSEGTTLDIDQFMPIDYTTFPLSLNPMTIAPTIPVLCNAPLVFPGINTFMQQADPSRTPLCVLSIDEVPMDPAFYAPPYDTVNSPLLFDPLTLISDDCSVESLTRIINWRLHHLYKTSSRYNTMTSMHAVSLMGALSILRSACDVLPCTAAISFLAAMGDPCTQTPIHYHWRSCIAPIATYASLGVPLSARWNKIAPAHVATQYKPSVRIIDPLFAETVVAWMLSCEDEPVIDIENWNHALLFDIIADYHITQRIPFPLDATAIAADPAQYITVNILHHVARVVRNHPFTEYMIGMPRTLCTAVASKVFNIIDSTIPLVYSSVPYCPKCCVAGICILDGNKHVRQRSLITLLIDPIWCAFICDTCNSRCTQIRLANNIIAPVISAHFVESIVGSVSSTSLFTPNRASLQMNRVCIAMAKGNDNRYRIRTNGVYVNSEFELLIINE